MSCLRSAFLSLWSLWLISFGTVAFSVWLCEKLPGASMFVIAAVWVGPVIGFHPILGNAVASTCGPHYQRSACQPFLHPFLPHSLQTFLSSDPQIHVLSHTDNYFMCSYFGSYSFTAVICCLLLASAFHLGELLFLMKYLSGIQKSLQDHCKPVVFHTYDELLDIICFKFLSHAKLMQNVIKK